MAKSDGLLRHWADISCRGGQVERLPHVYFVSAEGHLDVLKIGWTSTTTRERLADLQVGSPVPLRVLTTFPGENKLERRMHRRFYASRSHGEWFRVDGDLSALLDMIASAEIKQIARDRLYATQIEHVADVLSRAGV